MSFEKQIRSYLSGGAPEFALRARKVETSIERLYENLDSEYAKTLEEFDKQPDVFAIEWSAIISFLELEDLNKLIEKHNKFYPIERNLSMDRVTGNFMNGSEFWERTKLISKEDLFKRYPKFLERI